MQVRPWTLMVFVLAGTAVVHAQQPTAEAATPSAAPAVPVATPQRATRTTFAITSPETRQILRAAAGRSEPQRPASAASPVDDATDLSARLEIMPPLRFRGPRGVHHMECDSLNCTAYNSEATALYTVSRDEKFGFHSPAGNGGYDAWLSCQSTNNLLSTFERYDKCRGLQIGVPSGNGDVLLGLPRLNIK